MKSLRDYVIAAFIIVPLFIIIAGGISIYLISCIDVYILGEDTSFIGVSGIRNPFLLILLIAGGIFGYKFWKKRSAK
jgi:hypothetical protein